MTPLGRMIDPFLQGTLEMWETLCRTPKLHVFADVVAAFFASMAVVAGHTYFQSYSVANRKV